MSWHSNGQNPNSDIFLLYSHSIYTCEREVGVNGVYMTRAQRESREFLSWSLGAYATLAICRVNRISDRIVNSRKSVVQPIN